MTQPAPPPFDQGNQLLGEQPAQLGTALIQTPAGQKLALTIRTPSTTLTVFLSQDDGRTWGKNITKTADAMSGSGLIVASPGGIGQQGNGHAVGQPQPS